MTTNDTSSASNKNYPFLFYKIKQGNILENGKESEFLKAAVIAYNEGKILDTDDLRDFYENYNTSFGINEIDKILVDKGIGGNDKLKNSITESFNNGQIQSPEDVTSFITDFYRTQTINKKLENVKQVVTKTKPVKAAKVAAIKVPKSVPVKVAKVKAAKVASVKAPKVAPFKTPKVAKVKTAPVPVSAAPAPSAPTSPPINTDTTHINASISHITDKINAGYNEKDREIFNLRESTSQTKNTKDPGSTKEVQELGLYFINRINDILDDISDASASILKINLERVKHLKEDAKVVLTYATKTAILVQLDQVEKAINARIPDQIKQELDSETAQHTFQAFLRRNQVDILSIVAGVTAHNRTVLWLTRYALRRREARHNKQESDRRKSQDHDNNESEKLQTDRLGLRSKIQSQKVRLEGSRLPGVEGITPKNSNVTGDSGDTPTKTGSSRSGSNSVGSNSGNITLDLGGTENLLGIIVKTLSTIKSDLKKHFTIKDGIPYRDESKEEQDEETKVNERTPKLSHTPGIAGVTHDSSGHIVGGDNKKDPKKSLLDSLSSGAANLSEGLIAASGLRKLKNFIFGAGAKGALSTPAAVGASTTATSGAVTGVEGVAAKSGITSKVVGGVLTGVSAVTLANMAIGGFHGYNHPEEVVGGSKKFGDTLGAPYKANVAAIGAIDGLTALFDLVGTVLHTVSFGAIDQTHIQEKIHKLLVTDLNEKFGTDPFGNIADAIIRPRNGTVGNGKSSLPGKSGPPDATKSLIPNKPTQNRNDTEGWHEVWHANAGGNDSNSINDIKNKIIAEATRQNVDPAPLLALADSESSFRNVPNGKNSGASGIFQFIQETARKHGMKVDTKNGIDERFNIDKNIAGAVSYYKELDARYSGNYNKIYTAYKGVAKGGATEKAVRDTENLIPKYRGELDSRLIMDSNTPKIPGVALAEKTDIIKTQEASSGYSKPKAGNTSIVAPQTTTNVSNSTTISMNTNTRNPENSFKRSQGFDSP
jgi:hypothetical protein